MTTILYQTFLWKNHYFELISDDILSKTGRWFCKNSFMKTDYVFESRILEGRYLECKGKVRKIDIQIYTPPISSHLMPGFALSSLSPSHNLQCGGDTITYNGDVITSPYLLLETVTPISVKVTSNARVNLIGTHSNEWGRKRKDNRFTRYSMQINNILH